MRRFDVYTAVFIICFLVLIVAMSTHGWFGTGDMHFGLFSVRVDGRGSTSWRDAPGVAALARKLAIIGASAALALIAVGALVGSSRARPWIFAGLVVALLAVASFRVLLAVGPGDATGAGLSWWLAVTAILFAIVTAAVGLRPAALAPLAMVWCGDCGNAAQWIPSHRRVWCQHCALARNRHLHQAASR